MEYKYKCKVNRIIDADTIKLEVDLGFRLQFTEHFRLARIDAPEMRTKEGKEAKKWIVGFLVEAEKEGCQLYVQVIKHGKYRWVGEILIEPKSVDKTINLSDALVDNGQAIYKKF